MFRLGLAAKPANIQSWQDHTAQDAVRISSVARGIREDRASCRIAVALAMFCKLHSQLADDWNGSLAIFALRISRDAVPDRTRNQQLTLFVVLPIHPSQFTAAGSCKSSRSNQR